ncbi:MAG: hypothetical protein KAY24_16135, partial [Candidatus Eisenbacteria sp.]|nr:hypothetical protein [Candidatus Eisenbacteria bacterium]
NAIALTCRNCCSLWTSDRSGFAQLEFGFLPGGGDTASYLPFWRIEADVDGIPLASYADLVRAANLPKIPREEWEHQRIHFWSPAFKIQPHKFLRLARALTLAQPDDPITPQIPKEPRQPITLPASEAIEAVPSILATFLNPPQVFYPKLNETTIRPNSMLLVYIPFRQQGNELLHDAYKLTVNRNALRFGTDL